MKKSVVSVIDFPLEVKNLAGKHSHVIQTVQGKLAQ